MVIGTDFGAVEDFFAGSYLGVPLASWLSFR